MRYKKVVNTFIAEEQENLLVLKTRIVVRLVMGFGLMAFGGLMLSSFYFRQGITRNNLGLLCVMCFGLLFFLLGTNQLFNPREIRVDGSIQKVIIINRFFGFIDKRLELYFSEIEGVNIWEHYLDGRKTIPYWEAQLVLKDKMRRCQIDSGSKKEYINGIVYKMEKIMKCGLRKP